MKTVNKSPYSIPATISELDELGWVGSDISLEISLREYGLAWHTEPDGDGHLHFLYGVDIDGCDYISFDRATIPANLDASREWDWANLGDVASCCGMDLPDWLTLPTARKVCDMVDFYGYENVFGSSYWEGFTFGDT